MRKSLVLFALAMVGMVSCAAVDTIAVTYEGGFYTKLLYDWTSDASGDAVGLTAVPVPGALWACFTDPDDVAVPTDNYDIVVKQAFTLLDDSVHAFDVDLADSNLLNRDDTASQHTNLFELVISPLAGMVQIEVSNAGNATSGRVELYIVRNWSEITGTLPTGGSNAQLLQWASLSEGKWVTMSQDATIADGGAVTVVGSQGDFDLGGDDLTSSQATVNVFNATPTTINIGGVADVNFGNGYGSTGITAEPDGDLKLDGKLYVGTEAHIGHADGYAGNGVSIDLGVYSTGELKLGQVDYLQGIATLYGDDGNLGAQFTMENAINEDDSVKRWGLVANSDWEMTADGVVVFQIDDVTLNAEVTNDLKVKGNDLDIGDVGGFSGVKFAPATTTLDFYIDGVKVAHINADGSYSDDV